MKRLLLIAVVLCLAVGASAQTKERAQIPDKWKWNLADIYPSDDAWRAAKEQFVAQIPSVKQYRGTLGSSAAQLATAMETLSNMNKELTRMYVYAAMESDQDTRDAKFQAMKQEMAQVATTLASESAFVEPEILAIDPATLQSYIDKEPRLANYKVYLSDLLRRKAHTGTEGEEKIIADAGLMAGGASDVYGIFSNAEFPFPTIKLSDGSSVKVDQATLARLRASSNREDRKAAMLTYFDALGKFRATYGATMNTNLQKDVFYMKARKYDSTVAAALDESNIPVAVYTQLVDGVNASLPSFHRYLQLRKRLLGVDQLHYYDLYAPLFADVDLDFPIEQAQSNIVEALAPLGKDYTDVIQKAFADRWIDLYPNVGKRTGAYSNGGAYDVHPYMLINYNGKYNDMSTLAHELGHTMQSYFSNKTQPYPTAGYPIFVAEVASTFNEALLIDSTLKKIKDDKTRLSILGNYLEGIKGTLFRQTQFAEFELRAHQMAEKGEPITGEALDKLYLDITKKYYGDDKGVCVVDPEVAHEWAYIPHFYRGYYVYQYATSFTASSALSEKVLAGDKEATKKYRAFLAAGGSKYPIDLLKDAGVDMTTPQPLQLAVQKMNRVMDQMEVILKKMGK